MVDIAYTFGALMLGGMFAILFSGLTQAQTLLYFKLYPKDRTMIKLLVLFIWGLDTLHSAFIATALWDHLIAHYGDAEHVDWVPWSLALTIALTAVLTFAVHLFLIYRIFQLSRRSYTLTVPLTMMACTRLSFACLTTAKLVQLRSLEAFVEQYTWSFTTGLSISTVLDIFITASLVLLLRSRRKEYSMMNRVLDALMLYTFETGGVTTVATGVCLITWLAMKDNLIFMGLHFVISKFYANSLLITLNTRLSVKSSSYRTHPSTYNSANLPSALRSDIAPSSPNALLSPGGMQRVQLSSNTTASFNIMSEGKQRRVRRYSSAGGGVGVGDAVVLSPVPGRLSSGLGLGSRLSLPGLGRRHSTTSTTPTPRPKTTSTTRSTPFSPQASQSSIAKVDEEGESDFMDLDGGYSTSECGSERRAGGGGGELRIRVDVDRTTTVTDGLEQDVVMTRRKKRTMV